jgi:hypothetical protein
LTEIALVAFFRLTLALRCSRRSGNHDRGCGPRTGCWLFLQHVLRLLGGVDLSDTQHPAAVAGKIGSDRTVPDFDRASRMRGRLGACRRFVRGALSRAARPGFGASPPIDCKRSSGAGPFSRALQELEGHWACHESVRGSRLGTTPRFYGIIRRFRSYYKRCPGQRPCSELRWPILVSAGSPQFPGAGLSGRWTLNNDAKETTDERVAKRYRDDRRIRGTQA